MQFSRFAWALGCAMCILCGFPSAQGADAERGRALYEARCDRCHGVSIHVREARKATSFQEVRAQVARWNTELGGAWSGDEIDDVTVYLNSRFYSYSCPENVCRKGQAGSETGRKLALSRIDRR